ncbi:MULTISPECIES: NAD(P)/FAD-dependent oxidoreductase [unclassified Mesorhizobium]|uniref:NAD(P)/FAD-dependent oxidoreductase n=1 Tax=unclassified Mesorhizobium TaxID=325217 RepID=UPI0006F67DDC|nr:MULTISPECIES: NAD(P)/FAD-dependent oxidoreductase [unclassified Mesorhizobium]KQZ15050.1 thioredoxin reductase [Mesorhizobium sp. Root1471]KQZ37560.1 thioredoxin reductase [Mesorhizobium sp. Root554]MDR7033826.1 thioredoxin reductase [Mesorhizobium sp. BE184]
MQHDVIIIGGSYAGMAAALQLLRARRSVLVIDAGQRRNRFASHSYGFLGQDGVDPAVLAAKAREQLLAYPTLTWIDGRAETARGDKDAFVVGIEDGDEHGGRRLLFATGVADTLPAIEGVGERWGKSIFHCPYCHGYELGRGRIGVIGTSQMSVHQAQFIPEWGAVTFFTNDAVPLDDAIRADLVARQVSVEETPIARIKGHADVELTDGRVLSFAGLFTATETHPASSVAAGLGAELEPTPFGSQIKTEETKETTVPGAFACGDAARIPHSVTLAVGDGAWAGVQLHRSLVF